jgi:glyoxylase I family protein
VPAPRSSSSWTSRDPALKAQFPQKAGGRNVDHVCVALAPFDEDKMRAHMMKHEVVIEREAFHGSARGLGSSFYIRDPFGNKLELKGPAVYPDGR